MREIESSQVRVHVVAGSTVGDRLVAPGTTVGDALRRIVPNLDELLDRGFVLSRSFYPLKEPPSAASIYEPIDREVLLVLGPGETTWGRVLGKDEMAEALNAILTELRDIRRQLGAIPQLRKDVQHLYMAVQALVGEKPSEPPRGGEA